MNCTENKTDDYDIDQFPYSPVIANLYLILDVFFVPLVTSGHNDLLLHSNIVVNTIVFFGCRYWP